MRPWTVALLLGLAACSRPPAAPPSPAPAGPTSVLLVTVDTLRADRLGAYGDTLARTPNLDALAARSVLFERAFTVAPITLPAHATLFTGLLPPQHGVRGNGTFALGRGPRTLAEAFRSAGHRTAAFVGGFPVARRFGLDRGFDTYDDAVRKAAGVNFELAERPASEVVSSAAAWMSGNPGAVFVWVHLFDPHAPYDPPAAFRQADAYRGEVAATDAALGTLLAAWSARPGASAVMVTSDHGEAFGEHGEESHSLFVYDTTLRVPLMLSAPGLAPARRREPVSTVDAAATLQAVALLGGPPLPGQSLLGAPRSAGTYAETLAPRLDFGWSELRAWREGRYKYVRAPRPELYDVEADPEETRDLARAQPAEVARLEQALRSTLGAAGETETRREIDDDAAERLRGLGYVQGMDARGSAADPKDKVQVALRIARAAGPFPDQASAAREYAAIAVLDPENPLVRFRLADALLRSGRAADAAAEFRKVVSAGPRSADPWVGLATALAQQGELAQAEDALKQALRVAPDDGQVHFNLGEVARARGDRDGAAREYELAALDPAVRDRARARIEALR